MAYGIIVYFRLCILLMANGSGAVNESPSDLLALGDDALASENFLVAVDYYERGIEIIESSSSEKEKVSPIVSVSIYTNLGTALSSLGQNEKAAELYTQAVLMQPDLVDGLDEQQKQDVTDIAAQASFFLGMVHQELGNLNMAANAYAHANSLDKWHWGALANLGALLQDEIRSPADAIDAYNKAYEILTQTEVSPTDAPVEPRYILSQLQYRIGMCILSSPDRKCVLRDAPDTQVDCKELAANSFSMAVSFDPDNEGAKHMLASVTADATVKRASNTYVEELFEIYAENFEHSLVDELKYDGFRRLREAFNNAFGGEEYVPNFALVVDAGCGTGLVGEQFRNISQSLIGIDLSQSIINESKKKRPGLYNDTQVGDLVDIFRERAPISLIIAADSYIYFGDLDPLFESMGASVEVGGYVAFTLENVSIESEQSLQETKPDWRWQLTASGRFAHRRQYVEVVGKKHGLKTISYVPLDGFRFESGIPVRGHIFIMTKQQRNNNQEL